MGLLEQLKAVTDQILTNASGFTKLLTFTTPGGSTTKAIYGLPVKHSTTVDPRNGLLITGKNARATISEQALYDTGYPVRNAQDEVKLKDHIVAWVDSSGTSYTYTVTEVVPNRITGNIVLHLGDYHGTPVKKVIGFVSSRITIDIVETVNPGNTITLDNGDVIPAEYVINVDGTVTVPYMAGLSVGTPFLVNDQSYMNMVYTRISGTFDVTDARGGFAVGNRVQFNGSIPRYTT